MSGPLIVLTGIIYAYVAAEQLTKANLPMFVTYAAYSVANVGLYMMATK